MKTWVLRRAERGRCWSLPKPFHSVPIPSGLWRPSQLKDDSWRRSSPRCRSVPVSVWRVAGLRPFSFLIASWHVLRQELAAWRPDVLLWFDSPGQMAPLLALSDPACATVLFVNGLPEEEVQGVWRLPFVRWVLRAALKNAACRVQAVVSICREIVAQMEDAWGIPPERCHVIRNGVDEDRFHPQPHDAARTALGLPVEGLCIGFVGGFFPWHGLETLIEAVPIRACQGPLRHIFAGRRRPNETCARTAGSATRVDGDRPFCRSGRLGAGADMDWGLRCLCRVTSADSIISR